MCSRRALRAGMRRPGLLFRVQQPTHRAVPELFAADGRRGPLRSVAVAPARLHHPVQLRAAGQEHLQVHAGNVEGGLVYPAGASVHQGIARQQNLPVSTTTKYYYNDNAVFCFIHNVITNTFRMLTR